MAKFKNKKTGRVWDITNAEHLKHFRSNPRFEEIKEKTSSKETKKVEKATNKKKNKGKRFYYDFKSKR